MAITIKPKAGAPKPKAAPVVAKNPVDDEPTEQPVQLTAKGGKATVTKEFKDGTITEEAYDFPVAPVEGTAASVSMSMGLTRNLGNYESVKFSVNLTLPCAPTEEEVNKTFHTVHGWVDSAVNSVNDEISQQLK